MSVNPAIEAFITAFENGVVGLTLHADASNVPALTAGQYAIALASGLYAMGAVKDQALLSFAPGTTDQLPLQTLITDAANRYFGTFSLAAQMAVEEVAAQLLDLSSKEAPA